MASDPREFYDALADDYHLLFEDWDAEVRRQGALLDKMLPRAARKVLDVACGMGTQAIGLALNGYDVTARDVSPKLVARAIRQAQRLEVELSIEQAEMTVARPEDAGQYDAVIAFGNALPHLESDERLDAALRAGFLALKPLGQFLASVRDYDELVKTRPAMEPPTVLGKGESQRIVMQGWKWDADGRGYELEHLLMGKGADGQMEVKQRKTHLRALTRDDLEASARRAGFGAVQWIEPEMTGFDQPIFRATRTS